MTNDEGRMTNPGTMTNDESPEAPDGLNGFRRLLVHSSLVFRHSLVIRISSFVIPAILILLAGCGPLFQRKPLLYRVQGRVFDAKTKQGLANARVLLRAAMPGPAGTQFLSAYGIAGPTGAYDVELSEGFEVLRQATHIRIEASLRGYLAAGYDLPPPAKKEDVCRVPDIFLAPGSPYPSGIPRELNVPTRPSRQKSPLPWK